MSQIQGKYVLLTGGSRGLGPVIAEELAKRGAHIALAARDKAGLQKTSSALNQYGTRLTIVPVDLSVHEQREKLITTVLEQFGTIDILINNAGIETVGAYVQLSWEEIRQNVEVNLVAPMALTHMALPHMLNQNRGHIVQIATTGAKSGAPYAAAYCGTKAGLAEWTRALRLEMTDTGVHFSTIFPGYVTDVGMFARFGLVPPALVGSCTPADVANAVIEAIEHERKEIIVNSQPVRLAFVLNEVSPSLGDKIMHKSGVVAFQRRKVNRLKELQ